MKRAGTVLGIGLLGAALLVGAALGLAIAIAPAPPAAPLESIRAPLIRQDYRDLPALETYPARDGQALAYRFYPSSSEKVLVAIHGSAGHSRSMHALARHLARQGSAQVYALDVRGHGASGTRGDIAYRGQLDHDLADFLAFARPRHPGAPFVLLGFSAGGGFVLRVAGGTQGERFDGYLLLAPFLRYNAPTVRAESPGSGGWASASIPRVLGLTVLNRLGIHAWDGLPAIRFAVAEEDRPYVTPAYSHRLLSNFGPGSDFEGNLRRQRRPMALLVGSEDELFHAERFAETFAPHAPQVRVTVVPGVNHVGLIVEPEALAALQQELEGLR
jgi:alpha-beta hydrolase superfamily lysophospholipase